jgi:hypothetical protein
VSDPTSELYPAEIDEVLAEIEPKGSPTPWLDNLTPRMFEQLKMMGEMDTFRNLYIQQPMMPVTYEDDAADKSLKIRWDMNMAPIRRPTSMFKVTMT